MSSQTWPPMPKAAAAAAAAAADDWQAKTIIRLQEDLHVANAKVDKLSFEKEQQLLFISRIYNVVMMDSGGQKPLQFIKSLIERSDIPGLSTLLSFNSPIPSPQSAFSATTGPGSSQSSTEDSEDSEPDSLCGTMDEAKEPTRAIPSPSVDKDEAVDEEFSLEEELAGIADAPAKSRAAMRLTLREEQNARTKTLRLSAEEKRKTAEKEGQQLKKAVPKTPSPRPAQPVTRSPQPAARSARLMNQRRAYNETRSPAPAPKTSDVETHMPAEEDCKTDDDNDDGEKRMAATYNQRFSPNKTTESNPDILGVASSPKATDKFGVIFDPSKLDSATTARISGKKGSMDTRRSVLIENIPSEFTLHRLLAYVRGGTIVTVRLVPDSLNAGKGQMALITFKTAQEAELCCRLTGEVFSAGLTDDDFESAGDIRISRLPTATYPTRQAVPFHSNEGLGLSNQQGPTRCIAIDNFPRRDIHKLCAELSLDVRQFPTRMHALEEVWFEGNTLHMNFTSISEAEKAYHIISFFHYRRFAEQLHYCADPCATIPGAAGEPLREEKASSGCTGLKALLETVGLAAYSRSQPDIQSDTPPPNNAKQPKCDASAAQATEKQTLASTAQTPITQTLVAAGTGSPNCEASQLLFELFGNSSEQEDKSIQMTTPTPMSDPCAAMPVGTPWTAELMQGLELL